MMLNYKKKFIIGAFTLMSMIGFCSFIFSNKDSSSRIVSLNGTLTEILCAIGLEKNIVGVDVTSTFPTSVEKLPRVGHNRSFSTEGIVALNPTSLVGLTTDVKEQLKEQLTSMNITTRLYTQTYSVESTKRLIHSVAKDFGLITKGEEVIKQLDKDLSLVKPMTTSKSVLFIYARGAGTLMVSGKGTSVDKMIELTGAKNAVTSFNDFKPLTPEALLAANPDVILMFDSGLESIGGVEGLLKIQGIAGTKAGKNKKVISMDGQLLTGFGPRLGKALLELSTKIQAQ
jgi:iron complex transport system substrate-binding protein